jgi:hypothetical protein
MAMRIDYDYLKDEIFPKFLNAKTASISFGDDLYDLFDKSDPHTGLPSAELEKFVFHWKLMEDAHFVKDLSGESKSLILFSNDQILGYSDAPVSLTMKGQEFAENLEKSKPEWVSKITGYGIGVASEALKSMIVGALSS